MLQRKKILQIYGFAKFVIPKSRPHCLRATLDTDIIQLTSAPTDTALLFRLRDQLWSKVMFIHQQHKDSSFSG